MLQLQRLTIASYDIAVRSSTDHSLPSVLLVHGIGVSSAYFTPLMEQLSQSYAVHAIDLPGYGVSPKPKRPLTIPELSEVLAAYLKSINLKSPTILGHSMGCQVVAHLAVSHPELCPRIILVGPTVNRKERTVIAQAWRLLQDSLREPLALNLRIVHDYMLMGMIRYVKTSRYMVRDHIEDTLALCIVPVLIVRGAKDTIVPLEWAKYVAKAAPHGQLVEISDAPHVTHYKKAADVAAACKNFIDSQLR